MVRELDTRGSQTVEGGRRVQGTLGYRVCRSPYRSLGYRFTETPRITTSRQEANHVIERIDAEPNGTGRTG
jgi:hypothetical protein